MKKIEISIASLAVRLHDIGFKTDENGDLVDSEGFTNCLMDALEDYYRVESKVLDAIHNLYESEVTK